MTVKEKYGKIFSALIVPMDEQEEVNYDALQKLVEVQLGEGVEGFYCCGSSGEALLLSIEERKKITEAVFEAASGRVPVIAHVGTVRTKDVISLADHAAKLGCDAVSMIPPYYYKFNMAEITEYYLSVMRAVPGVPCIVYNIPQFTGVEFTKDNAAGILDQENVLGIKHTSNNLYSLERISEAYPKKVIFNGFDEQLLAALSMGADGTIGTTVNVFASLFLKVRDYFKAGELANALRVQKEINYRVEVMCQVGIFNATKFLCSAKGIPCGNCRSPFMQLSAEDKEKLLTLL